MTDQFDRATELEEKQREISLAYRKPILSSCGSCYNCGEHLSGTRLFCDADCLADWEKIDSARRRNGNG